MDRLAHIVGTAKHDYEQFARNADTYPKDVVNLTDTFRHNMDRTKKQFRRKFLEIISDNMTRKQLIGLDNLIKSFNESWRWTDSIFTNFTNSIPKDIRTSGNENDMFKRMPIDEHPLPTSFPKVPECS